METVSVIAEAAVYSCHGVIIIIIINNNAEIRVTLSRITLQGHFTELAVILDRNETKYSRVKSMLRHHPQYLKDYKKLRNEVRRETRLLAKKEQREIARQCKSNAKTFWKYVNSKIKFKSKYWTSKDCKEGRAL